jgi:hypothetical protein
MGTTALRDRIRVRNFSLSAIAGLLIDDNRSPSELILSAKSCDVDARVTRRGNEMLQNTAADHRVTTARLDNQRSKITSKPRKPVLAATSTYGKRLRDLMELYAEALGGWSKLSDITAANVRKAAELTALAERARHEALRNGVGVDQWDQLIRLENLAARSVKALGLDQRRREQTGPTLEEYVRQNYGQPRR